MARVSGALLLHQAKLSRQIVSPVQRWIRCTSLQSGFGSGRFGRQELPSLRGKEKGHKSGASARKILTDMARTFASNLCQPELGYKGSVFNLGEAYRGRTHPLMVRRTLLYVSKYSPCLLSVPFPTQSTRTMWRHCPSGNAWDSRRSGKFLAQGCSGRQMVKAKSTSTHGCESQSSRLSCW